MTKYKIMILPGDGIGREVMEQTKLVIIELSELYHMDLELIERPCGFEYMKRTGRPWPEGTFELCQNEADAILLGAVGSQDNTKPLQIREKSPGATIVLGLCSTLDLYANVRPVTLLPNVRHNISGKLQLVWAPEDVNMTIVRENTEGFYIAHRDDLELCIERKDPPNIQRDPDNEIIDGRLITRDGSERVIKFAFKLAQKSSGAPVDQKKRVTCVDKANVLNGCRLFRKVFNAIAQDFDEINHEHLYIDAFTQALIQHPEHFDVVVTTNLFGDIITDLAAVLQGGLGMAPSANIGAHHAMFEPVHGSAPDITGKNIANPIGMILSTQMMLDWLGEKKNDKNLIGASKAIRTGVNNYLKKAKDLPTDLGGKTTTSIISKRIIEELK